MASRTPPSRLCLIAATLLLSPAAFAQTATPVAAHYVARQRVEVLRGEEWWPAVVVSVDGEKYRVRTDSNEELIVRPAELRRYTRARSYPIKAAAEDVAAASPAPADGVPIRPGVQPAEPDPADEPKAKPAEPEPEPVAEKPAAAPAIPLPPAPNALPNDLPAGDLSAATPLASPDKVGSRFPFQPDPSPAPAHAVTTASIPLRPLDTRDAVFESPAPLLFTSPEFGQVFVPHRDRAPDAASDLYYDRYDLATGRRTGGFAVPPGAHVLDLSPDGTRLLLAWTNPDATDGVQDDCVGIFVVLDDRLTFRSAWRPYVATRAQTTQASVETGHFLDNTHILTSAGSDLTLWDADTNRAQYRLYPISPCKPAVSPGRKFVAVAVGGTAWVLDAMTGQPSLKLPDSLPAAGSLSFRPDGKQVALLMEDRLLVWDLGTGSGDAKLVSDTTLPLPNAEPATGLAWLSGGYVLVNRRYCVDLARQVLLWDYASEPDGVGGAYAGQYWYSVGSADKGRVFAHAVLPHDAALRAAERIDPATVMAVHPGAKVTIDLSQPDADDRLKARAVAALTAKLQANGAEVADNQPLRLVVTSAPGQTSEITYRGVNGSEATTLQVPEDLVTISFVDGGQTAWHVTRPATPPGTLSLRPGQTVEDYLAAERARLRLVAATQVTIPKYVPHPRASLCYGRSVLTATGPQGASPKATSE